MGDRDAGRVVFILCVTLLLAESTLALQTPRDQDGSARLKNPTNPEEPSEEVEETTRRERRKNVLFIIADDMRPEIAALTRGNHVPPSLYTGMHTPNLDELASRSLVLERAYIQQAICSPSRASALTGRRPDTTHVYDLDTYFRVVGGNFTTLPQYFKENGYVTKSFGKVFHSGKASGGTDPVSWSTPAYEPKRSHTRWKLDRQQSWRAVSPNEIAQVPLPDQMVARKVIRELQRFRGSGEDRNGNFFFAVGFYKPHLPFVFPEEYLNYYPESDITIPTNNYTPENLPRYAWASWGELLRYTDIARWNRTGLPNSTLPDDVTRSLRRAYYSSVSYVDGLVGSVLSELRRLGLDNDTVVAFWGDHGWLLGEHGGWCKHSNYELATHAPMMVRVPGLTDDGAISEAIVEAVDLYPTFVEAAGLPSIPVCPQQSNNITLCSEGTSFMPLILDDPGMEWKQYAFSQHPRRNKKVMGYSIRSVQYRFTQWVKFNKQRYCPNWRNTLGAELYDHNVDKDENHNVADNPLYENVVRDMKSALRRGWRHFIPTN